MSLRYSYNTNGCVHHRLEDAVAMIADAGYDGVALTPDIHHLDPFAPDHPAARTAFARSLVRHGLGCTVETGARFLLDPRHTHEPTLLCREVEGRSLRLEFLSRSAEIAAEAGAETMAFWAGVKPAASTRAEAFDHLRRGIEAMLRCAGSLGVSLSLEPEPGMLVETAGEWAELAQEFPDLGLALDVGHCFLDGEVEPVAAVHLHRDRLGTVHLEGMRHGIHEHLPLDQGDLDVASVLNALRDIDYKKLVALELSRDSYRADIMVPETRRHLAALDRAA